MSNDPKEILRETAWNALRFKLDDLGRVIHRSEDTETRLAFVRLVEAVQTYEDMKPLR
jgi:hypothetical protein